jgi:hypothetical protein
VRGGHGTEVAMEVVSNGRTKTVPAGGKRMEAGVPEESGEVKVLKRGAKVEGGIIHEEMMCNKVNPGKMVLPAVIQVVLLDNLFYFYFFLSVLEQELWKDGFLAHL